MYLVCIVLGIMYLCGYVGLGKALAICSIICGTLILINSICKIISKLYEEEE